MNNTKLIIGLGLTGTSCAAFLKKKSIPFIIFDTRPKTEVDDRYIENEAENIFFENIMKKDLINVDEAIISPGLDKSHKVFKILKDLNINIITDIDLFKRSNSIPIISITGTNGKTTIVNMLQHVLNNIGINSIACGNNGISPLLIPSSQYKYIILELSSYQLDYMHDYTSYISLISNIDQDHTDRHKSIEQYISAKKKIYKSTKYCLANISLKENRINLSDINTISYYGINSKSECIIYDNNCKNINISNSKISYNNLSLDYLGKHNLENILAVLSILNIINIELDDSLAAFKDFLYPSHRIELIKETNGIQWFNDSKSTNCASTIAALDAMKNNTILILGGSKKNISYSKLSKNINNKVKLLIYIGENKNYIKNQLKVDVRSIDASTMQEAVQIAIKYAVRGDSILLSPASPSYDMYKNYQIRGKDFKNAIEKYVI